VLAVHEKILLGAPLERGEQQSLFNNLIFNA
jgi:hypothetical protein